MAEERQSPAPDLAVAEPEERKPLWLEATYQDLRFALRTLRKSPIFTTAAILTLALGIGANTAIFQLLNAVRLRSLPVSHPESLAIIEIKGGNPGFGVKFTDASLTYPLWDQVRRQQQSFSGVFAWSDGLVLVGEGVQRKLAKVLWSSGSMFSTLGITPLRGRLLEPEDDVPGCGTPGVVISYGMWQSEFAGRDSAIGKKLFILGHSIEVIGVTPPSFFGMEVGANFDLAMPYCSLDTLYPGNAALMRPDYFWLTVMGRLQPGRTLQEASAQLESVSPGVMEQTLPPGFSATALDQYRGFRLAAYPGANGVSALRETYDSSLLLLLGITALVLLIACANLGNLMLARASNREREMAVRLALGATRERIIRQLLAEGILLSLTGAILGEGLANLFSRNLLKVLSTEGDVLPLDLSLDLHVLGFTASAAVLTCLVFGLAPAFRLSNANPGTVLKTGGRGTAGSREKFSLQRMLVVSQIAISLVLLIGALLFVRSFWNLVALDPGFRENGILLADVTFRNANVTPDRYESFKHDLLQQIKSIPTVQAAATSTLVPLNGSYWQLGVKIDAAEANSKFTWVSPEYFSIMDIPILSGRSFDDRDTSASPHVAIVNQTFARQFFGQENPVGKTFRTISEHNFPETEYQIVGVVKDTKYADLREVVPPVSYAPAQQYPAKMPQTYIFIRSTAAPGAVISSVREKLAQVSPDIIARFHILQTDIQNSLVRERTLAVLSGFFGALAALLSTIGLYGIVSYIIVLRTNEMGIRMALGASRGSVVKIILQQTLGLLGVGLAIGIVLALAAVRGVGTLLYGLRPTDPFAILGAALLLAGVALVASYVPAHRASRLDPMKALRYE